MGEFEKKQGQDLWCFGSGERGRPKKIRMLPLFLACGIEH